MYKRLVIGIDEAGYGPNLGPLTVARSVWALTKNLDETQICDVLSSRFRASPMADGAEFIPLGDSKQLYQAGSTLRTLEAGLLAMLSLLGPIPPTFWELQQAIELPFVNESGLSSTSPIALGELPKLMSPRLMPPNLMPPNLMPPNLMPPAPMPPALMPWYNSEWLQPLRVPEHQRPTTEIDRLSRLAGNSLAEVGMSLVDMRTVVVRESAFNQTIVRSGSKAVVLAAATMQLVTDVVARWPDAQLHFFCDRHGGRKDYLPLLLNHMPEEWFVQLSANEVRSSYRRQREPEFVIHFSVKGDSFPPTALASMIAKYCRERYMQAFNQFWLSHLPQLKPTAGYPVDAARFRKQITAIAGTLELNEFDWWRTK